MKNGPKNLAPSMCEVLYVYSRNNLFAYVGSGIFALSPLRGQSPKTLGGFWWSGRSRSNLDFGYFGLKLIKLRCQAIGLGVKCNHFPHCSKVRTIGSNSQANFKLDGFSLWKGQTRKAGTLSPGMYRGESGNKSRASEA